MNNYRKHIIAGCTFVGGLYFFLEFVLPKSLPLEGTTIEFGKYHEQISLGATVVGAMALGLGVINILMVHGVRVLRTQKGWTNSFALIAGMFLMLTVQTIDFVNSRRSVALWKPISDMVVYVELLRDGAGDKAQLNSKLTLVSDSIGRIDAEVQRLDYLYLREIREGKTQKLREAAVAAFLDVRTKHEITKNAVAQGSEETAAELSAFAATLKQSVPPIREFVSEIYSQHPARNTIKILYDGFFTPLGSAMFSLLAFYIAHAAYRSFRLRSMEAAMLMATAVIIILGQIPQGPMYISESLPSLRLWLLENINTPGNRAIYFGASIAGLAMAVRMWFSMERSPLDVDDSSKHSTAEGK